MINCVWEGALHVTWDWLENVLGCRARHSLHVLSLRHWSGSRGVGEQGDCPVKHPILMENKEQKWMSYAFYFIAAHNFKLRVAVKQRVTSQQCQKKHSSLYTICSCLWWCCKPLVWEEGRRGQRAQTGLGVCQGWRHWSLLTGRDDRPSSSWQGTPNH